MKKILVMRYRFIGDTLLTVPFLRNLRYNYPDAQIDMLVSTGSELPFTSEMIAFSIGNGNIPDSVPNVRPNVKISPVVPMNGVEGIE